MNDKERGQWVNNDEPLYRWWKSERMSLRAFIRQYRAEIDATIAARLGGKPWG